MIWRRLQSCSMANCRQLQKQLEDEEAKGKRVKICRWYMKVSHDEEIARIVSRWTGIPVAKLNESERSKTSASG